MKIFFLASNWLSVAIDNNLIMVLRFDFRYSVDLMVKAVYVNKWPVHTNKTTENLKFPMV